MCGSVLRRLAARAACAVFREEIQQGCSELQYAVGRPAGCEHIHKAVAALSCCMPEAVVLKFDCANAFNTMPRQRILDAIQDRAPGLLPVAGSWLCQTTEHLFWGDGARSLPLRASVGVDQGCPLSPALFALGLAGTLSNIQEELEQLSAYSRVFSYLDDVMVVVPAGIAERAVGVVTGRLSSAGLSVNAAKTEAWKPDPATRLPASLQALQVARCTVLGSTAPWLDQEGDFSTLGVHSHAEGNKVVDSARAFSAKLRELVAGGLGTRTAFLLLQAYSQGHVAHLLRANYEDSDWPKRFDDVILEALERLVERPLDQGQRAQAFLKLSEGGLGLCSAQGSAAVSYTHLTLPTILLV